MGAGGCTGVHPYVKKGIIRMISANEVLFGLSPLTGHYADDAR